MTIRIVWGATLLEGFDAAGHPVLHRDAGVACVDGVVSEIGGIAALRRAYPDVEIAGRPGFAITPGLLPLAARAC